MQYIKLNYKDEIIRKLNRLPAAKAKEVLEFICFIKHREALDKIDPTQLYFYTPKRQRLEKQAEADIKGGRVSKKYSVHEMDSFFADIKKSKQKKSK